MCLERPRGALQLMRAGCEGAILIRQRKWREHVHIVVSGDPADHGHAASSP
jgi:hypothetical protein